MNSGTLPSPAPRGAGTHSGDSVFQGIEAERCPPMKTITGFQDLTVFGIDPLTGEACGLSYRILCDVTEGGRNVLAKAFGIPSIALPEAWNRGSAADPHVGSVMLAPELLVPLAV